MLPAGCSVTPFDTKVPAGATSGIYHDYSGTFDETQFYRKSSLERGMSNDGKQAMFMQGGVCAHCDYKVVNSHARAITGGLSYP